MGMFTRMSDIIQANINAMLDKAEDPEKVIRLIIQEMEETLVEIRSVAAKQLAEQKYLQRQHCKFADEIGQWQKKAELAMNKGNEDLARAALQQKQTFAGKQKDTQSQLDQLTETLEKVQDDTARLNAKLSEARQKQKAMVARKNTASVRLKARSVEHSHRVDDAMARFDQYEQRIDTLEAQVDAYDFVNASEGDDLSAQFRELEADDAIEQELAELKKKHVA